MFYAWGAPLRNWVNVSTCLSNSTPKKTEGDTLGVRFFTAFCNHCTCAMVPSLLCNHWQFLLGFSAMAKRNQNQKKQKKMTRPNSLPLLPLGVCNLVFLFFGFLFSGSLLVFLQWLNKTRIQKNKKNDKTQLSATTPPFGVCNLVFFFGFLFSGSLLVFLQWLNKTRIQKNKKNKKQNDKTQLSATTPPFGVCIFLVFLGLFGFLFSGSLLVFWRAKDLDLTLCQFSHFRGCKFVFGWFYYLLWACGSIRKQCK